MVISTVVLCAYLPTVSGSLVRQVAVVYRPHLAYGRTVSVPSMSRPPIERPPSAELRAGQRDEAADEPADAEVPVPLGVDRLEVVAVLVVLLDLAWREVDRTGFQDLSRRVARRLAPRGQPAACSRRRGRPAEAPSGRLAVCRGASMPGMSDARQVAAQLSAGPRNGADSAAGADWQSNLHHAAERFLLQVFNYLPDTTVNYTLIASGLAQKRSRKTQPLRLSRPARWMTSTAARWAF